MSDVIEIVPDFLDSLFRRIGQTALNVILISSILLSIVSAVVVAAAESQYVVEFQARAGNLFSIKWLVSGMSTLYNGVRKLSESFASGNVFGIVSSFESMTVGFLTVVGAIFTNILGGYIAIAFFLISTTPPIVKPLSIVIGFGLFFIQFCVYWVMYGFFVKLALFLARVLQKLGDFFGRIFGWIRGL